MIERLGKKLHNIEMISAQLNKGCESLYESRCSNINTIAIMTNAI